jgi:hypothetical protein
MRRAVLALVAAGILGTLGLWVATGFDRTLGIILAFIVAFGVLAVAVLDKARSGTVAPARCEECGGLISPNAPYCKHCGARVGSKVS